MASPTPKPPAGPRACRVVVGFWVAAVGYFVVYPMLTDDEGEVPTDDVVNRQGAKTPRKSV